LLQAVLVGLLLQMAAEVCLQLVVLVVTEVL
jgi:hypothetical protein